MFLLAKTNMKFAEEKINLQKIIVTMNNLIKPEYESLIFQFRGFKVMIDADLALLYDVQTKRLKEQVKRIIERFPEDFMIELTKIEKDELVANCDRLVMKYDKLDALHQKAYEPRKPIGYKINKD